MRKYAPYCAGTNPALSKRSPVTYWGEFRNGWRPGRPGAVGEKLVRGIEVRAPAEADHSIMRGVVTGARARRAVMTVLTGS